MAPHALALALAFAFSFSFSFSFALAGYLPLLLPMPSLRANDDARPTAPLVAPTVAAPAPVDLPGLHNVVAFHEGFYSGGVPEGDVAFDALKALGVRTVISVDGAIPDVAAAKARGIRYVHLPIGYDGFDDARKAQLVRAVRDLPKPIYVHCHHGKHRSAGAAAVVGVSLGWFSNDVGAARMKVSGTAEGYKGLWSCAAKAAPMMAAAIEAASPDFPEVTKPDSMTAAMVAIDEAHDRLRLVEKNAWRVPADHPDLAPAADAGKLADLLLHLKDDAFVVALPAEAATDFRRLLAEGRDAASALEEMLAAERAGKAGVELDSTAAEARLKRLGAALKAVTANCKACHVPYRD